MEQFFAFANSPVLYIMAACVILFVMAQSIVFGVRAWKQGKQMGIATAKMRKIVINSTIFTIVPSISILLSLITMAGILGVPLPWVRLSVVGSAPYELIAADMATKAAGVSDFAAQGMDASTFVTVALVMTTGISWGLIFIIFFLKKINKKVTSFKQKDSKWGKVLTSALFIGMVSAFLGTSLSGLVTGDYLSIVALCASGIAMAVCLILSKKCKIKWIDNFALAFSMIIGMTTAALFAPIL